MDETSTLVELPLKTVKDNFSYIARETFNDFIFVRRVFFSDGKEVGPDDLYLKGTTFPFIFELVFSGKALAAFDDLSKCALHCRHKPPNALLKARRYFWPSPRGYLNKAIFGSGLPLDHDVKDQKLFDTYENRMDYSLRMRASCSDCPNLKHFPSRFTANPACRYRLGKDIHEVGLWLLLHPRISPDYRGPLLLQSLLLTGQVRAFEIFTLILLHGGGELSTSFHDAMQKGQDGQFIGHVEKVLECLGRRTGAGTTGTTLDDSRRKSLIHDAYHYLVPEEYYRNSNFDPEGDIVKRARLGILRETANPFRQPGT